jgi:hypothetical protein
MHLLMLNSRESFAAMAPLSYWHPGMVLGYRTLGEALVHVVLHSAASI